MVNTGQGQGGVGDLGWLQRGRLAWALSGALGVCSLPPISRGEAGPGGSRLAHVTGLWWGRTWTFCWSPKLLRPPPQFPASCPMRPWTSHQGPAALPSFQCAWSLESQKPVPRPRTLCGPGIRLPREAQHEPRKSASRHSVTPSTTKPSLFSG